MADNAWSVYALKYTDRNHRQRVESFIFDDDHFALHAMDYFIWVLRRNDQVIVIDTGYDDGDADVRGRPIIRTPAAALRALNIDAEMVDNVIITHLHYDHAGGLIDFPKAKFHIQAAEMAYATGPCMCHPVLQKPFTADHICQMVQNLYSGRVVFYEGDAEIVDGVRVHLIGGHSRGLQAVTVLTESGWLCLASDTAHYYENVFLRKPFPIVVDLQDMLDGFETLETLASTKNLIVPGHDPLVTEVFPEEGQSGFVWRLDKGPMRDVIDLVSRDQ